PGPHRTARHRDGRSTLMTSVPIPNVIARHPQGERIMDVYSHLLSERIVYLGTPIDAGVANLLIAQLLHLESNAPEQDVQLYINCEGGDSSAMLAVVDTMRASRWNRRPRS